MTCPGRGSREGCEDAPVRHGGQARRGLHVHGGSTSLRANTAAETTASGAGEVDHRWRGGGAGTQGEMHGT